MRTRTLALLVGPLLLLATACADQIVTAPQEALQHHSPGHGGGGDGGTANYEAILLSGRYGHANAVNDAGIVVGDILSAAVRWVVSSGGISGPEELGALPGRYADSHQHALAVNGSGVIVGYAVSRSHGTEGAFVYSDQTGMQLLPWFVNNTYNVRALAINDQGIIAGWIDFAVRDAEDVIIDRLFRAAVWLDAGAEPILLPPLEDHDASRADAIGMNGIVTGHSRPDRGSMSGEVGVSWRINADGQLVEGPYLLDDGFRPGSWVASWQWPASGNSPNEAGDFVGWQYSATTNWSDAALLREGRVLLLGSLLPDQMSYATGINDPTAAGVVQIVGQSGWEASVATLWTVDADETIRAVDLGAPRNSINASALGINARGLIVGRSASRTVSRRPTIWLPQEAGGGDPPPPSGAGPTASFSYRCQNTATCQFTDTSTPGGSAIGAWLWTSSAGHSATTQHTPFTFTQAASYTVTLRVTDGDQRSDEAAATVNCSMHQKHGLRCS